MRAAAGREVQDARDQHPLVQWRVHLVLLLVQLSLYWRLHQRMLLLCWLSLLVMRWW